MHRPTYSPLAATLAATCVALLGACATQLDTNRVPAMPQVVQVPRPMGPSAAEALARAREKLGRGDFEGAVAAAQSLPEQQRPGAFRQLAEETAREEPALAGRFALAMPAGVGQHDALAIATRARVAREPESTLAWSIGIGQAALRFTAMEAAVGELVALDPRHAVATIQALPESPGRLELFRLAAARWARGDVDGALAWAAGLGGEVGTHLTTSIGFEVAQTDPERAVKIAGTLPEGRDRWLLLSEIAQTWTARNPDGAIAWMRGLPEGAAREAALAGP
jgi:hypothetical protein